MIIELVKGLTLDYMAIEKMMVAEGNTFRHKESREYEASHLHTPYKMVVLMLNRIFGRAEERYYKFGWIPLIYHVSIKGIVFNRDDIVTNILSSYITTSQ